MWRFEAAPFVAEGVSLGAYDRGVSFYWSVAHTGAASGVPQRYAVCSLVVHKQYVCMKEASDRPRLIEAESKIHLKPWNNCSINRRVGAAQLCAFTTVSPNPNKHS
jgi:hypothetical protein